MSAWYRTGTISSAGNVVTGTGTKWADNKMGIGAGQMLIVPGDGTVKLYEILAIDSDTKLRLVSTPAAALSGAYAIASFYTDSVPDFARRLAAQLSYYQSQMDGWQQIMTGTGNVTIIAPDGTSVVMPSFNQMNINISNKAANGANGDITELNALTKAITIAQGGTGGNTLSGAQSALGIVADAFGASGVASTPWLSLTISSGWTGGVTYRKVLGMLQIKFSLTAAGAANGSTVATLPVGYRPIANNSVLPFGQRDSAGGLYPMRFLIQGGTGVILAGSLSGAGEVSGTFLVPFE
ncbi:tail protein [Yersinia phage vB_YenS_P400]|nr:tail protein [Yersinia phage vB_YenS_P400]